MVVGNLVQFNVIYCLIVEKVSDLKIDNQFLEQLVEFVVYESLDVICK